MKKIYFLLLFLVACGGEKTDVKAEELEILKDEIFSVRLQVLPEHEKTLPRLIDSLNARKQRVRATRADSLQKAILKLDSARTLLQAWQKSYDSLAVPKNPTLSLTALRQRKEDLLLIRRKTLEGIQHANNLLMLPSK